MLEEILFSSFKESVEITTIIFVLMVVVELLVLRFKTGIKRYLNKRFYSYVISSFFGIIPGCVGTFAMDSMYMIGLLSFGGIIAVMIATSGDEAFLLLSMAFTGKISIATVVILTAVLFVLGIIAGIIADFIKKKTKMRFCKKCSIEYHKKEEFHIRHFVKEHIWNHIIKKHIWQIFLWVFAALFIIELTEGLIDIQSIFSHNMWYLLIIASLIGLLPISGPNAFLVVMFSQGLIPFSVLLANSIIQDGHGLLPILGFSVDDAIKIKVFNFIFGLAVGAILLALGI